MKLCSKCKIVKPLERFSKSPNCKDGRRNDCKDCTNKQRKESRRKNIDETREKGRNYAKIWMAKNAEKRKMYDYAKIDDKKQRSNDLDIEYCIDMMNKPCVYCGFVDSPCNGLDRIDNNKGHLKTNCVTCCSLCNTTRMDNYSHDEFMMYIAPGIRKLREDLKHGITYKDD